MRSSLIPILMHVGSIATPFTIPRKPACAQLVTFYLLVGSFLYEHKEFSHAFVAELLIYLQIMRSSYSHYIVATLDNSNQLLSLNRMLDIYL